jgi:myotubularin-related protein 1/2
VASVAAGGGYEFGAGYEDCRVSFMGIDNIHIMRDSFESLFELLQEPISTNTWFTKLESTAWLKHIRMILSAAGNVILFSSFICLYTFTLIPIVTSHFLCRK